MVSGIFTDRNKILEFFNSRGLIVDPAALQIIMEKSLGTMITHLIDNETMKSGIVGRQNVLNLIGGNQVKNPAVMREIDVNDIKANSSVEDFRKMFVNRYETLKSIIVNAGKFREVDSISSVREKDSREVKIVGMISNVTETRNGHKKFRIEDTESYIDVIILKKNPMAKELLLNDEVVGVIGSRPRASNDRENSEPVIFANELIRPDIPERMIDDTGLPPEYVCSISDIHVGSKTFIKNGFSSFLKWINSSSDESANLKHLILSGDVVDGIGVYPNQENDLEIVNPKEQYEYLAEFVNQVPSDINVYIMPGNHDTVRLAEPQPELSPAIRQMFTEKVTFLPNPYNLRIKKKLITLYHGMSLNDLIELIPGGNMNSVGKAIELMLKRRYMGPVYGGRTPIIPNQFDPHIFRDVPDIFITGHIHGHYLGNYNGVRYVNSSTWQSQTEYQKMMNYSPDPCIATLFDLNSKTVIKKNFLPKAFSE
ncbi:DNA-directed DNA polymerase II small subunit [Cuniculiplasma divulgatum]|uniref:DNA polymerase II small subunit n=1 Tax=Cuniculiplasma divulgatum TaxID=1673428 RepID=A0A1N5TKD2_9ARCH|nr:DNA-directed DNA polymerase II small subunit [Cuniculiplasma divulgatum]SIM48910.1 family D DNA polymerase small subunit [Cuniculiplasma divulgatum]